VEWSGTGLESHARQGDVRIRTGACFIDPSKRTEVQGAEIADEPRTETTIPADLSWPRTRSNSDLLAA
jgi:hypothetical protein